MIQGVGNAPRVLSGNHRGCFIGSFHFSFPAQNQQVLGPKHIQPVNHIAQGRSHTLLVWELQKHYHETYTPKEEWEGNMGVFLYESDPPPSYKKKERLRFSLKTTRRKGPNSGTDEPPTFTDSVWAYWACVFSGMPVPTVDGRNPLPRNDTMVETTGLLRYV